MLLYDDSKAFRSDDLPSRYICSTNLCVRVIGRVDWNWERLKVWQKLTKEKTEWRVIEETEQVDQNTVTIKVEPKGNAESFPQVEGEGQKLTS